jgi:hypothetical protein
MRIPASRLVVAAASAESVRACGMSSVVPADARVTVVVAVSQLRRVTTPSTPAA